MVWGSSKSGCESLENNRENNSPPPDVANLAYLIYFSLGVGVLLPWNSYITAVDYFYYLYPDQHVDRVFSVAYIFPCLIALWLLMLYGQRFGVSLRINVGLALYLVCLVMVPAVDSIFIEVKRRGSAGTYYFTVGAVVVTGIADAVIQGSLIGSAGELPERYMQAVVAGTAASGVLTSVLRIVTKAVFSETPGGLRQSGYVYFGVSVAFLVLCLVAFNSLPRLPIIKYYRREKCLALKLLATDDETKALVEADDGDSKVNIAIASGRKEKSPYKRVLMQVKWLVGSLALVFVITLSIFPGFISEDVHSAMLGDWYAVLLFTTFNLSDLVGKGLTALYIPDNVSTMIGGSVARVLLIPLFAVCLHGPQLFRTEVPVFLLCALLGVTSGYVASALMIVTPKTVPFAEAESAGVVITIAIVLGLAMGSAVSWVWIV